MSTGQFTCRNQECASHGEPTKASYRVLQDSDWLRVFYVPLVPVSQGDQVVECDTCGDVVTLSACDEAAVMPAVPFVVDAGPKLEITARNDVEDQPQPIRLVVGAPDGQPLTPSVPARRDTVTACGERPGVGRDPEDSNCVPEPPKRPAGTSCGLCGTGRTAADEICAACGAVFTDRSARSCVRHRIALPTDADCPVCGPDGVHALEPAVARSAYFG